MIADLIAHTRLRLMRRRVAMMREKAWALQSQSRDDYFAAIALDAKAEALESQYNDRARQWGFIATE
jgi:hypothetical protein